jgi:hypothetical protein
MNRRLCAVGAGVLSVGALLAATSLPASAATGDTLTTFALAGGALSIVVQPTAVLGGGASGVASVSGPLGVVTVTDIRGSKVAWSAFGTSTTFVDGAGTVSTGVSYSPGTITTTGTVTMPAGTPTVLTATPAKVAGPTSIRGNNTASWTPTLTVSLPPDALAGAYSGTVNTSVS